MLVCSECLEKEIKWSDGASKYSWCDDCVPRGCSCNYEVFCHITEKSVKDGDTSLKDSIEYMQDTITKYSDNIKLYLSKIGVELDKNQDIYVIHLEKCNYEIIDNKKIFEENFIKEILNNKKYSLKMINVDEIGREYPCVEIMELGENIIKEKGEVFFSLHHNMYCLIGDIYHNGNFRVYPITDIDKKEIDNCNPIHYKKNGFVTNELYMDLLISEYEAKDEEFIFLNNFIFNTSFNIILEEAEKTLLEMDLTIMEEFNADWSYYCIYEHENASSLNDFNYINKKIKEMFFIYIEKKFDLSYNDKEHLLNDIIMFHKLNDEISMYDYILDISLSYNDVEDYIQEEEADKVYKLIRKREKIFKKIFSLVYNNVKFQSQ